MVIFVAKEMQGVVFSAIIYNDMKAFVKFLVDAASLVQPGTQVLFCILPICILIDPTVYLGNRDAGYIIPLKDRF